MFPAHALLYVCVETALRLGVGVLFLMAGLPKIVDPEGAVQAVAAYRVAPPLLNRVVGTILPYIELICAIALLLSLSPFYALSVCFSLLVVFSLLQSVALARGLEINCGCFGSDTDELVSVKTITRNVLALTACAIALFIQSQAAFSYAVTSIINLYVLIIAVFGVSSHQLWVNHRLSRLLATGSR